jgi:hypothetical protein
MLFFLQIHYKSTYTINPKSRMRDGSVLDFYSGDRAHSLTQLQRSGGWGMPKKI